MKSRTVYTLLALYCVADPAGVAGVKGAQQSACPLYASGLARMEQGDDQGALQDFEGAANSCSVETRIEVFVRAGDIYLRQMPFDAQRARTAVAQLRAFGDLGNAKAFILSGRIRLADDPISAEIENAINDFKQARALNNDVAAEAFFYTGEARRLAHADESALSEYREVIKLDPGSVWGARALLGAASAHVGIGDVESALGSLQQVRRRFPSQPEATTALDWSTILYRVHLRGQSEPIFKYSGAFERPSGRIDGVALAVDAASQIVLAHKGGWVRFSEAGKVLDFDRSAEREFHIGAMAIYGKQSIAVAREGTITLDKRRSALLEPLVQRRDGRHMPVKVTSLVVTPWTEWIFGDDESGGVYRIWRARTSEPFVQIKASRLAVNARDDLAVLDPETRTVKLFGRNKALLGTIPDAAVQPKGGVPYSIGEPVDIAFDGLGNLYILDGRNNALHIFDSNRTQIGRFAFETSGPAAVRGAKAMALGASGRLYVLDGDSRIRVFQ